MFRSSVVAVAVVLFACGDDGGANRLPDAPLLPDGPPVDMEPQPPQELALAITKAGNGTGRVTSDPAGIDCGDTCEADFEEGAVITLTAEPDESSLFDGWSGACAGTTTPVCEVTVADATSVTATFTLKTYTVTVTKSGAGAGTIAGNGIDCGATCEVTVDHGTAISLTATPVALNNFVGWGGACSGTAACAVTVTEDTAITAVFALDELSLTVARSGNGAGTITSAPAGINCPTDCDQVYTANQMVTLTAAPAASSTFTGWSGACTGTGTCTVTMDAAKAVTATFTLKKYALTVTKSGTGGGTVTSAPAGIACGADCTEQYDHGTSVVLTAAASTGSTFAGWSGACTGTGTCTVTVAAATSVTAQFTLNTYALTATTTGSGAGTITGTGISCPGDCSETLSHGTVVALTATPAASSTFTGWSGACTGTGACSVTMDGIKSVTANFTIKTYALTVATVGTGTVTGTGIACPGDCTETLDHGSSVALTAAAGTGYTFTGWSGACTGTGACTVSMDAAKMVTATFTINTYTLTTTLGGNGTGTITTAGINCPGDCSESLTHGTTRTLTAAASATSNFTGWTGACTGTGACTVTMDGNKTVGATFALKQYALTVTTTGSGSVTGTQIACPSDCTGTYDHGTAVALTPTASGGFQFTGWGGSCSGTGACTVTMDMARTVSATFTPIVTLTVAKTGTGAGTVTSTTPAGAINCGSDCSEAVLSGTTVTLAAAPNTGSTFTGWSGGGCSGTGACTVTVAGATTVTAAFAVARFPLTVTLGGNGVGSVTSAPAGIACTSGTCTAQFDYNTSVTLTAVAGGSGTTASQFNGWGGACAAAGLSSTCTTTIAAATSATAKFDQTPNIMFVTSKTESGVFGGFDGALAICRQAASSGGLLGSGPNQNLNWVPVISTQTRDFGQLITSLPAASFPTATPSGWVRPDGAPIANTFVDIASNNVHYPPRIDELRIDRGAQLPSQAEPRAWTYTNSDGKYVGTCTSTTAGSASYGLASANSNELLGFGTQACSAQAHLLCMGVDRESSVTVTPQTGRQAFTSTATYSPAMGGLSLADKICQDEANTAGLSASGVPAFRALLATDTATAASRFDLTKPTWVRTSDKQRILASASQLSNDALSSLIVSPNSNAAGTQRFGAGVTLFSGAERPGVVNIGTNCDSWQGGSGKSRVGHPGDTTVGRVWFNDPGLAGAACTASRRLVCLEN